MANIHTLIVKYDSTSPREGSFPIDLNCGTPEVNKLITAGIYDMDFTPPKKVSNFIGSNNKLLTRIEDCDGSYILVEDSLGYVNSLVVSLCEVCVDAAGGEVLGKDCDKPVHTKDCDRDALIEKLQEQIDELVKIFGAVDGLELTTENIRIEAGQINLNTDQVEELLTQINDLIALKGSDCANALFIKDCGTQDVLDKLQEVIDAINSTSDDEQTLLTEISTKLDDLSLIKEELVTANTTLSGIKTDTAQINTNLEIVIDNLESQIIKLEDLKALVTETNFKLDTANATLSAISADIATIKTDISAIKADVSAIKTSTASIDTKLSTVVTSLASIETKLDTIHSDLTTINTTLQTEFDQTQAKLDDIKGAIELKGSDCTNKVFTNICNFQELADAINAGGKDYTAVLDSIDGKLDDIADIKTELVTVNANLLDIKANTAESNVKLDSVIAKLDAQTTILTDIKAEAVASNVKLDDIKTVLNTVSTDVATIKADVAIIKTDIAAIKTGVQSIDTKLTSVVTSLANVETKLDTLHDDLTTINTTLQTEFDQTQVKLEELITAVKFAQDTFQKKDCSGNNVGVKENVLKVIQLAKQTSVICNASDIYEPIVGAITAQTPLTVLGKRHSAISLVASAGNTFTVPDLYTTVSMFVAKGEFKVTSVNDFSLEITKTGGTISSFIELSSDGIGTATGATDVPQSLDTRANTKDLESGYNGYTIECVRAGVIQLELYKD